MKYGELTKCFTNNHSATISYRSEGHSNVIVNHAKRALSFLKKGTFSHHFKSSGARAPSAPPPSYAPAQNVIEWFGNIEEKTRPSFISFETLDFYPSISGNLLDQALSWAVSHHRMIVCMRKFSTNEVSYVPQSLLVSNVLVNTNVLRLYTM